MVTTMTEPKRLHILWTNDNFYTSSLMVITYATNSMAYHLWDSVTVIIWGATVKLAAENELIQEQIKTAQHAKVNFSACISCARQYGVVEKLESLGIEVVPWTEALTDIIRNDMPFISV